MSIEIEAAVEAEAVDWTTTNRPSQALAIIVPTAIVRPAAAFAMLVPKLIADTGENASLRFLDLFTAYSVAVRVLRLARRQERRAAGDGVHAPVAKHPDSGVLRMGNALLLSLQDAYPCP